LFKARGAWRERVVIDAAKRPGVVQMSTGAWYDPDENGMCKHGNPNVLTRDKGTSKLGQGPSAHSCLIEVELFKDAPPPVTAHKPPQIIRSETSYTSEVKT